MEVRMVKVEDLQVVVIDCVKDFWSERLVVDLFTQVVGVKLDAYGRVYGDNVISLDKADFFGTHILLCSKKNALAPIVAYKSVSLEKCKEFHFNFPCNSLVENDGHKLCKDELREIISTAKLKGEQISFDYSWGQGSNFNFSKTDFEKKLFQDITMMLGVKHHEDFGIKHMIACGVIKVKTNLFFQRMGLNPISSESVFDQTNINHEPVQIFHNTKFSDYAYEVTEKYSELWDNRIEFSRRYMVEEKIAA